jgi:hypothetical protein
VSDEFVQSVRTMHVTSNDPKVSWPLQGHGGIDRVSFDMNMSSHEETAESDSVQNKDYTSMSTIERFRERKFGGKAVGERVRGLFLKFREQGGQRNRKPR